MVKRRDVLKSAAVASGITTLAGCASESGSNGNSDSAKIGVLAPLTGGQASAGTSIQNGANLRAQQIQDNGGIGGETEIELVFGDSKCSPSDGTTVLQDFVSRENINFLVGGYCSPVTLATIPTTSSNNIVQITPSEAAPITGEKHEENVFREGPQAAQQAPIILKYASEEDGNSSFDIIAPNNDWGVSQAESLKTAAGSLGVDIKSEQHFSMDTSDFSTVMTKVKNSNADGLISIGYANHNINQARSYDNLGITKDIYGSTLWGFASVRNAIGDLTAEIGVKYPNIIDPTRELTAQFREDYRAEYNEEAWANASWGYGGIQILEQAIIGAGSTAYEDVVNWLYENEVKIVQGEFGFAECGQATVQSQIARNKKTESGEVGVEPMTDFEYGEDVLPDYCS